MVLNKSQKEVERQLLATCLMNSGAYLPGTHGSGSWATTYSNQFILASAQLLMLYKSACVYSSETELSTAFRNRGIRSCRGADMTIARTRYLIETHLAAKIIELNALA